MYFNNYIKDKRNQVCLDLGFEQWVKKFYPRLTQYKCALTTCRNKENTVICPGCENTFYCSEECRIADTPNHIDVCAVSNTREMLFVNSFIGWKINPILSLIAMAKYKQMGPGIIQIRSYNNIWDFKKIPNVNKLQNAKRELSVFISYIPLNMYKENSAKSPNIIYDNQYRKKMVINFQIEGMNKSQLYSLPLLDLAKSEPEGLEEFMSDPMSRINTFQVSFDAK